MEIVPSKSLKCLAQEAWLLAAKRKGLQNLNTALSVHCRIRASYFQLIISICKQKDGQRKKPKLKDMSSLTVLIHDCNC